MQKPTLEVRSLETLAPLANELRLGKRKRFRTIVVDVPGFTAADNEAWQAQLRRLYFACGCELGAAAAPLGLLAFGGYLVLRPGGIEGLSWKDAGTAVVAMFLAAGAGKALGLVLARLRLSDVVERLQGALRNATDLRYARPADAQTAAVSCGHK
jgi:hypothetical protein